MLSSWKEPETYHKKRAPVPRRTAGQQCQHSPDDHDNDDDDNDDGENYYRRSGLELDHAAAVAAAADADDDPVIRSGACPPQHLRLRLRRRCRHLHNSEVGWRFYGSSCADHLQRLWRRRHQRHSYNSKARLPSRWRVRRRRWRRQVLRGRRPVFWDNSEPGRQADREIRLRRQQQRLNFGSGSGGHHRGLESADRTGRRFEPPTGPYPGLPEAER